MGAASALDSFRNPFHVVAIPNMGLTPGEIFYHDELAADCAADGLLSFLRQEARYGGRETAGPQTGARAEGLAIAASRT